ncbi:GNAT family N-acetyltransferase [Paracoccus sediminicola]|uniref:GNAT family N-acetyltransferase n=1 Tax=Paracoccus sediminicola TaxID=3017783 RepID=UPI0022F0A579|nr:GNAT family N-acetyltransferase [Paracoccus sediminicola]WBU56022.1 GNAT family N-acetyltransferase [Paracoccus sediminicola]
MTRLHAACFHIPRPWREAEFASLLAERGVFLCAEADGFAMGRVVLDEAELLTLAVAPESRRAGLGGSLLAEFEDQACQRGAVTGFLEVASDNRPALALYLRADWVQVGRRPRYYAPGIDAILMRKALIPTC